MNNLKIEKMPESTKIFWNKNNKTTYKSFYNYTNYDMSFKYINDLQSAKEFYEISPKFAEDYNITEMFKILKEKFNTEQLILFAFYRYDGEINIEYMFRYNDNNIIETYYIVKKDNDIIYKPRKQKAQKFMVAVNPIAAIDALSESARKCVKNTIAGQNIYKSFLEDSFNKILDKANKEFEAEDRYCKPLHISRDNKNLCITFSIEDVGTKVRRQITDDLKNYIYNKYLKQYFESFNLKFDNVKLTDIPNISLYVNFENLLNNNKQEV